MFNIYRAVALLIITAGLALIPGTTCSASAATFTIGSSTYTLNNERSSMDASPFIKGGRTYIPLRYAARSMGILDSGIVYDGRSVKLTKDDTCAVAIIGESLMTINNKPLLIDAAPFVVNGRTYMPIRHLAQAFGYNTAWDPGTKTVHLYSEALQVSGKTEYSINYRWSYRDDEFSLGPVAFPKEIKTLYTQKPHPSLHMNMRTRENNFQEFLDNYTVGQDYKGILSLLAANLKKEAINSGYEDEIVPFTTAFVQGLLYQDDNPVNGQDDYAKYPVETLYDNGGDCEDTSILAVTLLRMLGYDCALLLFPGTSANPGHMAVGLLDDGTMRGAYYVHKDKRYYYLEITSAGWKIGDVPPAYRKRDAYVLPVK